MSKHLFILLQETLNPSSLFIVMCVTWTEFSSEAIEGIL